MKKLILKRLVLLTLAFLLAVSVIPAEAVGNGLFASAGDADRELKATLSTGPAWLENLLFDAMVYRDRYSDLAGKTDAELKTHWLNHGIADGRTASIILDLKFYRDNNADLKSAYGNDFVKLYNHFVTSGYKEKRPSSRVFDGSFYCNRYPEVASSYKNEYIRHFMETGIYEGRRGNRYFDGDYYWFIRPDVEAAWPGDYKMAARHYMGHGCKGDVATVANDASFPTISDISVTNVSSEGYTIICKVKDNWGLKNVAFCTWTTKNGEDDKDSNYLNTQKGTKFGDYYTFRVKTSAHNNETGEYNYFVRAIDKGGNDISSETQTVNVKGTANKSFVLFPMSDYLLTDKFVKMVKEATTVADFTGNFDNEVLKVFNENAEELTSKTVVGTGNVIKLYNGSDVVGSLNVIISGDLDGDGLVTTTDCMRVKATFLGMFSLSESQTAAADADENGFISSTDYMRLKYSLLNKKDESDVASKPNLEFPTELYVTENNGKAQVITSAGIAYTASGYISYDKNLFTVKDNFKLTFDNIKTSFNRLTLCFVSSNPMNCTVTYKVGGTTINDLFYLEAGTQTFSALIKGYLESKKATEISAITLSTCEGVVGTFALCLVKIENYTVYDGVYKFKNNYYELGLNLSWGGGICHLVDRREKSQGLSNLINQHDTGRLVQQSYYGTNGTSGDGYVMGYYNNANWPYNPVQGGDKGNTASRIIDIVVSDTAVYLKAQPMDWGHVNKPTISYMENLYVLEKDYVRVDNRFVDFSGYTHRYADQELPAFYTVSYFDNFTYYGGSKSWTNDTLSSRNDLKFWGDPAYHSSCWFKMKQSNTETWCAWTNSTTEYGIGLYVPNVDRFLAGRSGGTTMSKDPNHSSTNYVAPVNVLMMVSYKPIEYSYLMKTGTLSQIRKTFSDNRDFATNESLHENYKNKRDPD